MDSFLESYISAGGGIQLTYPMTRPLGYSHHTYKTPCPIATSYVWIILFPRKYGYLSWYSISLFRSYFILLWFVNFGSFSNFCVIFGRATVDCLLSGCLILWCTQNKTVLLLLVNHWISFNWRFWNKKWVLKRIAMYFCLLFWTLHGLQKPRINIWPFFHDIYNVGLC